MTLIIVVLAHQLINLGNVPIQNDVTSDTAILAILASTCVILTSIFFAVLFVNILILAMVFRRLFHPQLTFQLRNLCDKKSPQYFNRDGDSGNSKTINSRVLPKDCELFNAIGATEELLSSIGLAREHAQEAEHEYSDKLKRIQTVIIDLSTAISRSDEESKKIIPKNYTKELEDWIHEYSKALPPPEQYIIPGGGIASASLHVARAICRRAERVVVPLVRHGHLHNEAAIYLNRLSDFLFVVSRIAAKLDKRTESIYIPKPDEKVQAQ